MRQVRQGTLNGRAVNVAKTVEISAVEPEFEQVLESYPLTERELEILELIVAGCSNAAIAEKLYLLGGKPRALRFSMSAGSMSPDPPIRLEAPVIHAGEEKRTRGFSRLHSHS